jgi:DNA-binding transcriptional LysR family regulator
MDLRQLRYFVASAEEGHMGRAAARLFVVQSALSRQVQELEREIGAPLFQRTPRGVRLTDVGAVLLEHARRTLAAAEAAMSAARSAAKGEVGRLRVAPPDHGERTSQVAAALDRFRAQRPDVQVELVPVSWTDQVGVLQAGSIDVAFGLAADVHAYPDGVTAAAVSSESMRSALIPAGHPLAARRTLSVTLLAEMPLVLFERRMNASLHDAIMQALRGAGCEPKVIASPESFAGVVQLVAGGAGWAPVLDFFRRKPPSGTVARPVRDLRVNLEFHALRRSGDHEPLAASFMACLRV